MPVKRRNGGRSKKNRGHTRAVHCNNCARLCGKDKIIKRFHVRNIVDASSQKDIEQALVASKFVIPKIYEKKQHCISCAIHSRIVRVRSGDDRKVREPQRRAVRTKEPGQAPPKPSTGAV